MKTAHTTKTLIKETREHAGLTQRELAAKIGISQGYYAKIELGQVPRPHVQNAIALALGVTTDTLWV